MGKFKGRGFRQERQFTKGELMETYEKRFESLANAIQQVHMGLLQQLMQVATRLGALERQLETIDYRSLSTRGLAIDKSLFTDDEHTDRARELRIEAFNEESAKDDERRKLEPADGDIKLGDWAVLEIEAKYPETIEVPSIIKEGEVTLKDAEGHKDTIETKERIPHPKAGEKVTQLSSLRSKVQVGSGSLMPELEKHLVGLTKGQSKEVQITIPKGYGELAEKDVKFKLDILDHKRGPKPEAPSPTKEDANAEESKEQTA